MAFDTPFANETIDAAMKQGAIESHTVDPQSLMAATVTDVPLFVYNCMNLGVFHPLSLVSASDKAIAYDFAFGAALQPTPNHIVICCAIYILWSVL